jgi:hypothetical protein
MESADRIYGGYKFLSKCFSVPLPTINPLQSTRASMVSQPLGLHPSTSYWPDLSTEINFKRLTASLVRKIMNADSPQPLYLAAAHPCIPSSDLITSVLKCTVHINTKF